jgi:xylose dehydrogenase (NAD/NADP)
MDLHAFEDLTGRDWDTGASGTLRMAVVGVGGFARKYALPAIRDADYCDATVLVSGSPTEAQSVADEFDVSTVVDYEAYDDGEAAAEYDAAYVATPNAIHRQNVETAASLGKHVLTEKPIAATVAGAEDIVETCRDAGVRLMTAYRMQTHPVVRRIRTFLRDGGIGDPVHLHGDFTTPVLAGSRGPDQWRLDPELAGGGALMDVGVYPLNTARFVLREEPTGVSATACGDGPFDGVDERVAVQLSFGERITGSFTASFSGYGDSRLSILGENGRIELEPAFRGEVPRTLTVDVDGTEISFECPAAREVREEFDYFAHAVLTGGDIEPDGDDGLADVRIMRDAYRAAERGTRVDL